MESKALVEGFEKAPTIYMNGCYYVDYVRDGDSSVADSINAVYLNV